MVKDAGIYPADSIMFDLEDSVSVTEKDSARFLVYEALNAIHYPDKELIVRINALDSKLGIDDLEAMVRTQKVAIRLPKTENAQDVLFCEEQIARIEEENGIPLGSTMIWRLSRARRACHAKEFA
jgi:citrate lyase subunit beta/citryl-CoA lyase